MLNNVLIFSSIARKLSIYEHVDDFLNDLENDQIKKTSPVSICFANAHAFNISLGNHAFRKSLLYSDFLLRDGVGVKILLSLLKKKPGLNMNGTDLIPRIISHYSNQGKTFAVFGTSDDSLIKACEKLEKKGMSIVASGNGFHDFLYYYNLIKLNKPDVVLLGMGMPKQEEIALLLKEKLSFPVVIVNGGAIIDFISGRVSRSPSILRVLGLEWFYRLLIEPRRLWRRYMIGNIKFVFIAFLTTFKIRVLRTDEREY